MGVTKLRLARFGARNTPFYRLVAIDSRKPRDAAPIEYLGAYNPMSYALDGVKEVRLRVDRIKYWLSVGAQPSERVAYLLWRAGLVPAPPIRFQPTASRPRKEEKKGGQQAGYHTTTGGSCGAARRGGASSLYGLVLGAPALSTFSGLFSRPGSLFRRG